MDELVRPDLVGRPLDDHAAVVHHRHLLGDAERDVHVVLDHDQRQLLAEGEQQIGEELALAAGEPRARLVEHHHLRLGGERDRERDLALLAVGEVADELGKLVVDRDAAGAARARLAHLGVAREQDRTKVPAPHADDREVDVVLDGQAAEEARLLVGAGEAHARARARGQPA